MKKNITWKEDDNGSEVSRRIFCKAVAAISLGSALSSLTLLASAEDMPTEPQNVDDPTPWQEGDPVPVEKTIPAKEPEQTSTEAPPCQPMDDYRPEQPGNDYVWVNGYWWWSNQTYVWVPGYWALPPHTSYVYISGYWTYRGNLWVFVRGGWAKANTTVIVSYPMPRSLLIVPVIPAPIRIIRRHRRWRHYHTRRAHHRAVRRRQHRVIKRKVRRHGIKRKPGRNKRPLLHK